MFRPCLARACASATICVLALTACGGGEEEAPRPATTTTADPAASTTPSPAAETTAVTQAVRVIEVAYAGGQVSGGVQTVAVRLGEKVRLRVTSDVAELVHVHTYDDEAAVSPGQPAEIELTADIPGRHEVELEKERRALLVLEVR